MKICYSLILFVLVASCKKQEVITCPEVLSPADHSTFQAGDTIAIVFHLPPPVQGDSAEAWVEIYNKSNSYTSDTFLFPPYGRNHTGTVNYIAKSSVYAIDTLEISTWKGGAPLGGPAQSVDCSGITIYVMQ